MSILRAMYTGVTGINAEGEALGTVGDNISNINTVGFKEQRTIFEDMLGHSITAGSASAMPGSGVMVGKISQLFTQGSLSTTGVNTDVALNGDGFFTVNGSVDGVTGNFYTRAGNFNINKDGYLVNPEDMKVQGYQASANGTIQSAQLGALRVPTAALPPAVTTQMTVTANLDANATTPALAWDAQNPAQTSNFSTSMQVYDSLGNAHTLNVYFRKTAANTWDYHVLANSAEVTAPATTPNVEIGSGSLAFTTNGALQTITTTTPVSANFVGATAAQPITLNWGTPVSATSTGLDGMTQFGSPSNVSSQSQDGYASGDLSGVSVNSDGTVMGMYTNGQKIAVGQLAIAKFRSNEGLGRAGNSMWIETRDSGVAAMGVAGSGGRGAVSAGALEQSNVDLAKQFVDLIAHQRAFQADSKTITTADEMLQELVNIKR
jgi:flagellar hook protein FlgE